MNENLINLVIQAKNLSQNALNQVKGQLGDLQNSAQNSGSKFQAMGDIFRKSIAGMAIVGGILGGFGIAALTSASQVETMAVALETSFGGNIEMAKNAQKQITEFATKTPYDLNQVMNGFIKLKNMGLDPSEKAMTSYGNTASAMGKDLNMMVEAVADAATGEFERLKEFGVKAKVQGDNVTLTFKGVATTIGKNSKEIEDYLIKLGETNFAGGMEKQSQTLAGKLSTLKDTFSQTMASFAMDTGLLEWAKKAVDGSTTVLSALKPLYDLVINGNFTGGLTKIFGWEEDDPTVDKILQLRTTIIEFVENAWKIMKNEFIYLKDTVLPDLQSKFQQAQKWFEENKPLVETLAIVLGSLAVAWGLVTLAIGIYTGVIGIATIATTGFAAVVAFLTSPITLIVLIIGTLIAIGVLLWKNWDWLKLKAQEIGQSIANFFGQYFGEVGERINWLVGLAGQKWNEMLNSLGEFGKSVHKFFSELLSGIIGFFTKTDLGKAGAEMMQGFQNSIWAAKDGIMNAVGNISSSITSSFKNAANSAWNAVSGLKVPDFGGGKPINGKGSAVDGKGSAWAKGGAFQNGSVVPFASGGIVDSPTNFGMSGGRTGLMGEAGPEAIMPLTRMSGGKLGVKAEGGGTTFINHFHGYSFNSERDKLDFVKFIKDSLQKELKLA